MKIKTCPLFQKQVLSMSSCGLIIAAAGTERYRKNIFVLVDHRNYGSEGYEVWEREAAPCRTARRCCRKPPSRTRRSIRHLGGIFDLLQPLALLTSIMSSSDWLRYSDFWRPAKLALENRKEFLGGIFLKFLVHPLTIFFKLKAAYFPKYIEVNRQQVGCMIF